jgi:hypothetical protein
MPMMTRTKKKPNMPRDRMLIVGATVSLPEVSGSGPGLFAAKLVGVVRTVSVDVDVTFKVVNKVQTVSISVTVCSANGPEPGAIEIVDVVQTVLRAARD